MAPDLSTATRNARRAVELAKAKGPREVARRAARFAYQRLGAADLEFPLSLSDIADSSRLEMPPPPPRLAASRPLVIGFLSTPPGIGSGGHTTMFRMVEALEAAGHQCEIVLYDRFGGDPAVHQETIKRGWPAVAAGVRDVSRGFAGLDACVATAWQTAHVMASRCRTPLHPFFFVQDFEPYFYPHGSEYALAMDTYRFGFRCITIGYGLPELLKAELGVEADAVDFGCDTDVYHLDNLGPRNGVVFYAKPTVPRRGYIHNVAALADFHGRHPEQQIHVFGQPTGDLGFPAIQHGQLTPAQLNDLYNQTLTGFATSFTNMSLVAEEMLAAGNIPVINDTLIGRAGLDNPHVRWADPTPGAMSDALCAVVESSDHATLARDAADSVRSHTWAVGQAAFVAAIETGVYADGVRPR